ncbi:MAG: hypothetical protein RL701_4233, partial [Pseudomonadota bacterium]
MEKDEALYKAFLRELEAIEHFRVSYTGSRPAVPLGREDPDVQRLIEAMALFTARTRLTAERSVMRSALHLFQQHFPYLLNPLPATAMLQAVTSSRYVDASTIPKGSEVRVTATSTQSVTSARAALGDGTLDGSTMTFRTMRALRVLPLSLMSVDMYRRSNKSYRLLIQVEGAFFRNDTIGEINLYLDHL